MPGAIRLLKTLGHKRGRGGVGWVVGGGVAIYCVALVISGTTHTHQSAADQSSGYCSGKFNYKPAAATHHYVVVVVLRRRRTAERALLLLSGETNPRFTAPSSRK